MILSSQFITDFGDSSVAFTLSVVLALAFFTTRNKNAALAMLLAFVIAALLITVAKIALHGCWFGAPLADLRSPSGHAAISTAVYGSLALILAAPLKARYRVPLYLLTAAFILMICVTRITLGYHSVAEVMCGIATGAFACAIVWALCLRRRPVMVNRTLFVVLTLAAIILVHGIRLPAETLIDGFATRFASFCLKKT